MKQVRYKYNTKTRNHYKTDSTYIQAVYRNNKMLIDEKNEGIPIASSRVFKQDVLDYMEQHHTTVTKAVGKVLRSRKYLGLAELSKQNLVEGMKTSGVYKQFRELTKDENGRYAKFDYNKLQYKGDGVYAYGSIWIYTFDKYTTNDNKIKIEKH